MHCSFYKYLYIDVVAYSIWSHNVLLIVVMLTYALCTERVTRIAARQVYFDSRDTDLSQILFFPKVSVVILV